jgi:hypothetical protein
VALLVALILLLMVGVGGASVYFVRRQANPLVSGATGQLPSSPGVAQGVAPGMPSSPNIVSGDTAPPPGPSSPITSGAKGPDGMAPSVLMAPGTRSPSAGSVTQAPSVRIPESTGITQGVNPQMPGGPPVMGANPSPPVPDNSDFDRYINWLRFVENERKGLRAQGETEIYRMIPDLMGHNLGAILGDPDNNNEEASFAQMQQNQINKVNRIARAMQIFAQSIRKTKPPVPSDCKALDSFYMSAMDEEARQTVITLEAFARQDIGRLKQVMGSGVGNIDSQLGLANLELEKAYRGRGLNKLFTISTGGNSSLFGGLVGTLGAR